VSGITIGRVERLLERDDDLATLVEAAEGTLEGQGAFVLLGGEAGIGKTSLVRVLRARVEGRVAFLLAACEPLSVPVPLGPLRELAEATGAGDLSELHGGDRFALARALLGQLRARAPAVAVVDDAHWADPGTLDVLRLLARRVEDAAVVIVLTYRDDELGANAALASLVGISRRARRCGAFSCARSPRRQFAFSRSRRGSISASWPRLGSED
jgi:predicted ATPase